MPSTTASERETEFVRRETKSIPLAGTTLFSWWPNGLGKLLLGDVLVAGSVTFCISPFVAMVDQAIVQRSAGTHTIMSSVRSSLYQMCRHPNVYFRSPGFLWMWALYAGTYTTANTLKTLQEQLGGNVDAVKESHDDKSMIMCTSPTMTAFDERSDERFAAGSNFFGKYLSLSKSWVSGTTNILMTSPLAVVASASSVNVTLSLLKDKAYTQLFGNPVASKPHAVPKTCYAMWMVRDSIVVASSFFVPDLVVKSWLHKGYIDYSQSDMALRSAQVVIPILSQVVAGPIHLWALNVYQHPETSPFKLLRFEKGALSAVIAARMTRIVPGFSVGVVGNSYMRDHWRSWARRS